MKLKEYVQRVTALITIAWLVMTVFIILGNHPVSAGETETNNAISYSLYLWIEGESQGPIDGIVTDAGKEGSIEVLGFSHQVVSPRDAKSGLPTGKRLHSPLRIVKRVDKSSALLIQALTNNENLIHVTLRFYGPDPKNPAVDQNYYVIRLENAQISSIQLQGSGAGHMETVSFVYQKIIWISEPYGTPLKVIDYWETPIVI